MAIFLIFAALSNSGIKKQHFICTLRDFLKQFYIRYSRRGALSAHVRIKKWVVEAGKYLLMFYFRQCGKSAAIGQLTYSQHS